MNKLIELPKPDTIEEGKIFLFPLVKIYTSEGVKVKTIEQTDEFLRIDFVHFADPIYINGGWVHIHADTFIRPSNTKDKLVMVKAEGIPIAPAKHYYKSKQDKLNYSLYFPSIGKGVEFIDIIEREGGGSIFFNFFGVAMSKILSRPILVQGIHWSYNSN